MIPEYLLAKIEKSDVIYRCIGNEMKNGILACGFMRKETADRSQYHFSNEYYSCFVLLRGSGEYIAEDGTSYPLQAGSLVQRLPGVPHSTRVDPDGKWLEFFISIGKPFFDSFCSLSVLNREPVLKAELLPGDLERYQKLLQSLKATPDSLLPLRIPEMEKEILRMYGYHAHRVNLQRDPIEAACDMLSQNLDEEISLEELARSLQIGYETFRKVFKKQTGVSPAPHQEENGAGLYSSRGRRTDEGNCRSCRIWRCLCVQQAVFPVLWIPTWKVPRTSSHGCAGFRTVLRYRPRFYVSACPG